jgi:hypothetical protein
MMGMGGGDGLEQLRTLIPTDSRSRHPLWSQLPNTGSAHAFR